jgi:ComF family protein
MNTAQTSVKTSPVPAVLRAAGAGLLDQLYPPVCLNCDAPVARADGLCADCWRQLRLITPPFCSVLGLPFEVDLGPHAQSAEAIADPPPFVRSRSAVVYTEVARKLVSRLKYGDRPEIAKFCAQLMWTVSDALLDDDPVLVPVPLYRWRLFSRRYNQSLELARELARLSNCSVDPLLVMRTRRTRQQVGLSADQRSRNVAGAFAARSNAFERLAGRKVVIIDDVITTGATVKAVTRALKRAGVEQIFVLSFARVVAGIESSI